MRITNINTLSALFDRLITERIKWFFFKKDKEITKVKHQEKIIKAIKLEICGLFHECCKTGNYNYLSEKRTFDENSITESLDQLIQDDINIGESDRARLEQVKSEKPSVNKFLVNEKRLRKANEDRAIMKNKIDEQLSTIVKEK